MNKLTVLFHSPKPQLVLDRHFPYSTLTEYRNDTHQSFTKSGISNSSFESWENLIRSPIIDFDTLEEVTFEQGKEYVYLILCQNDFDICNLMNLFIMPEEMLNKLALNNVHILYDHSLEAYPTWGEWLRSLRGIRAEMVARNPSYSGSVIVSTSNTQPPGAYPVKFVTLPAWFTRSTFEFERANRPLPTADIVDRYLSGKKVKLFLNLNRNSRYDRVTLVHGYSVEGVLDHGLVSLVNPIEDYSSVEHFADSFATLPGIDKSYCFRVANSVKYSTLTRVPMYVDDLPYDDGSSTIVGNIHHHDSWSEDVCFDVISETSYTAPDQNSPMLTEKIVKAFRYGKPFMINGDAGSLRRVKDLGFRTFPYLFDESYDDDPYLPNRQQKIIANIKRWVGRQDEFMSLISLHREDLDYNYHRAMNFPEDTYYKDILLHAINTPGGSI